MLRLEDLRPAPGSHKRGKRVGRGDGSGRGKTAGRGTKGQKSRSGYQIPPGFEGGQTPLWRRVPKRGFKNPLRREYAIVNLETLAARYPEGAEISPEDLLARGIIKKRLAGVKVLGRGELNKKLIIKAERFSKSALAKINAAGGEAIPLAAPVQEPPSSASASEPEKD